MTARRVEDMPPQVVGLPAGGLEDKELTLAFQRGEDGSYQAIYDRYAPRVHAVCRRMLGQREDANEAAQETFLRVYQALGKFNGRYQLGPWVSRIATNVCLDQLRSRARHLHVVATPEGAEHVAAPEDDSDPETLFIRHAEGHRVRGVLARLPATHRAAIVLREFEGMSYDEIGTALGMSEAQVKALLHRARKNFRRSWSSQAPALVGLRDLFQRLRFSNVSAGEPTTQIAQAAQVAQAAQASAMAPGVFAMTAERFGAVAMAVVVTGGVGAGVAGAPARSAAPAVAKRVETAESDAVAVLGMRLGPRSDTSRAGGEVWPEEAWPEDPAEEQEPEAADQALGPSEPSPAPSEAGDQEPAAEPSPPPAEPAPGAHPPEHPKAAQSQEPPAPASPAPPAEPAGFTLSFGASMAADGPACSCTWATSVESQSVSATEAGLNHLSQSVAGTATAAGSPAWGVRARHVTHGADHGLDFSLHTPEGSYSYSAAGSLQSSARTEWGGWVYRYSGTYRVGSRPSMTERVPESGAYSAEVVVSWRRQTVVSSSFLLY